MRETKTTSRGLQYYRTWSNDGAIVMLNAKTLDRYRQLKKHWPNKEAIKKECDPQEVYFYEFNNHECQYAWDGDTEAIEIIIELFGVEVAKTVHRFNVAHDIDYILIPRDIKHTRLMLGRLVRDCDYYLGNGGRYAKHLWAGEEQAQIAKMRELLNSLPENMRPDWLTAEKIDEYEKQMCNDKSLCNAES